MPPPTPTTGISEASPDRAALEALYRAADGPNWTNKANWLSDAPLRTWYGVDTNEEGRVTELDLYDNQLRGEIPSELGDLSNLESLYLSGNRLSGCIPEGLRDVKDNDLDDLVLPFCSAAGATSADRAALEALYNATGGPNWTNKANWLSDAPLRAWHGVDTNDEGKVTRLKLHDNQLSGEIPSEMGRLSNLELLLLYDNQLTGEIPPKLGGLSNLKVLHFGVNHLTGEIPSELDSLSNLEFLDLSYSQLTGEIPSWLGNLANLEVLTLSANQLTGEIPSELGRLTNLVALNLLSNRLSGGIPPELGRLTNLVALNLLSNRLSGEIPSWLGNLANLELLHLSHNQMTGEIPPELGRLSNLLWLDLSGNQLSGAIPYELGGLTKLRELSFNDNQLIGKIPSELDSLSNLESLYLSGNRLSGCIPEGLRDVEDNDLDDLVLPYCSAAGATSADTSALETLQSAATRPDQRLRRRPLTTWFPITDRTLYTALPTSSYVELDNARCYDPLHSKARVA